MKKNLLIALLTVSSCLFASVKSTQNKNQMKQINLPTLPYKVDALQPVISESTVNFHYNKHLQTYINNLNQLIKDTDFENADLITIVEKSNGAIFNNAAQAWNHEFYFNTFSPKATLKPTGVLAAAIDKKWGSLDGFKKEFEAAGLSIFGSGWVWLAKDASGELMIIKGANAENPLTSGLIPLLGMDVWEHAYYLDYQNRRADHLANAWKIIDWKVIESRY